MLKKGKEEMIWKLSVPPRKGKRSRHGTVEQDNDN